MKQSLHHRSSLWHPSLMSVASELWRDKHTIPSFRCLHDTAPVIMSLTNSTALSKLLWFQHFVSLRKAPPGAPAAKEVRCLNGPLLSARVLSQRSADDQLVLISWLSATTPCSRIVILSWLCYVCNASAVLSCNQLRFFLSKKHQEPLVLLFQLGPNSCCGQRHEFKTEACCRFSKVKGHTFVEFCL